MLALRSALLLAAFVAAANLLATAPTVNSSKAPPEAKSKDEAEAIKLNSKARSDIKRVSNEPASVSLEASSPDRKTTRKSSKGSREGSTKFQPRMMNSQPEGQHASAGHLFQGGNEEDNWDPHNIMPTFTDQEQGDEMVALASEQEAQVMEGAPFKAIRQALNRSISSSELPLRAGAASERAKPSTSRPATRQPPIGAPRLEKQRPHMMDEYYGEPADDEEMPPEGQEPTDQQQQAAAVLLRAKALAKPQINHFELAEASGFRAQEPGRGQQLAKESVGPAQASFEEAANRSAGKPGQESTWIPSATGPLPARTRMPQQNSFRPTGERLAELFGSGGSGSNLASKADMAIEYLKNVLKDRQQQQANSSTTSTTSAASEPARQYEELTAEQRNVSISRLTSFASKLSQMISSNSSASSESAGVEPKLNPGEWPYKFSIGDVKATTSAYAASSEATLATTRKSLSGELFQMYNQQPQSADLNPPNGSPLGGDYIESMDDFPRQTVGLDQQQLASQQVPVAVQHPRREVGEPKKVALEGAEVKQPPSQSNRFFRMQQPSQNLAAELLNQQQPYEQLKPQRPLEVAAVASQLEVVTNKTLELAKQMSKSKQAAGGKQPEVAISMPSISSKLYKEELPAVTAPQAQLPSLTLPAAQLPLGAPAQVFQPQEPKEVQPVRSEQQFGPAQPVYPPTNLEQQRPPKPLRPPKLVSYSASEEQQLNGAQMELNQMLNSAARELFATNYQLGDALYSSTGGLEHALSPSELEAIQSQFMTAEHPVVPLLDSQHQQAAREATLAGLLANQRPSSAESLQKLSSPERQAEEVLKELASNQEPEHVQIVAAHPNHPPSQAISPPASQLQVFPPEQTGPRGSEQHPILDLDNGGRRLASSADIPAKKKSLIVYLNHPRPLDMSNGKEPAAGPEPQGKPFDADQQTVGEFISAKEFDAHGLSKDDKQLDVGSLRNLGLSEGIIDQAQADKEGLSVVVIGDAYKYKKIVLLISSKSGGLKFIPMVKEMRR